ncbi:MAG TPA: Na+/H+ antiporter subunit D [Anaeromyxobacter sp.]|nr:Na+/H+ antiporter subunit D [Anaeromyxobacter sp.]
MNVLVALPILIPLTTAALSFVAWRSRRTQTVLSLAGGAGLLASTIALVTAVHRGGILSLQAGDWPAPFGITLVADGLGALMALLAGLIGVAVLVSSIDDVDRQRKAFGYHPLVHVLLAGVCGAFLTGDLFNLYVWFEVLLIASFVLLTLGGRRDQVKGGLHYVALNLISSALFLAGAGILYGLTGTLNLADLSVRLASADDPGLVTAAALLFFAAFGIKAAVFPLFFWLPASYHTPPAAVSALFAGLLTKVGVYALIRVFTLLFRQDVSFTHGIIVGVAAATMVSGVLGAASQSHVRRILAFHIVSQIGYMLLGLGLFVPLALAGAIFYVAHHILVKTNLFLLGGVIGRVSGTEELARAGGLWASRPLVSVLFLVPALSLAGIPPLSGFHAKLFLVRAGLEEGRWMIVAVALVVSLLTLYSMTKIWNEVFAKAKPAGIPSAPIARGALALRLAPSVALAALTLLIGLVPGLLFALSQRAAEQLLDPRAYIAAVLGGAP